MGLWRRKKKKHMVEGMDGGELGVIAILNVMT